MVSQLPPFITGPQADRLDISKRPPKLTHEGHFLSVIAFDGNITSETVHAIMAGQIDELKRTKGTNGMWRGWKFHPGEGQVRSRNECADFFLKSPCTHHDFIDADVIFQPRHIQALRRHPEAEDAIIVGLYCKKQDRIAHPYNSLKDGNPAPNKLGLMEVAKGPTGFMQIPRTAYEAIMAKFPERRYLCDYEIDDKGERATKFSFFFHDIRMDQEMGFMRDQSEDWAFCEMARAAGVKIYADVSTTSWDAADQPCILHRGPALYPLRTELERLDLQGQIEEIRKAHGDEVSALKAKIAELTGKAA